MLIQNICFFYSKTLYSKLQLSYFIICEHNSVFRILDLVNIII